LQLAQMLVLKIKVVMPLLLEIVLAQTVKVLILLRLDAMLEIGTLELILLRLVIPLVVFADISYLQIQLH
jgi:hypothetical protein